MHILDGKKVADEIVSKLAHEVSSQNLKPRLDVIALGDDEASQSYIRQKEKAASAIGIEFVFHALPENTKATELISLIHALNSDPVVSGIIVQLPLPEHINAMAVIEAINPAKDVDGFHPINLGRLLIGEDCFASSTPAGIIELLKHYNILLDGKRVTIIGRSNIVGKPLSVFLMNLGATVTVCHSKTEHLNEFTKNADIIIAAVGHPGLVTAAMIKQGAVVIDAGWSRVNGKVVGDVLFDEVSQKASAITPVPGGVGPMTVATLMKHTVEAYKKHNNL